MQSRVSLIMTQTDMQVYMEGKHKTVQAALLVAPSSMAVTIT